MQPSVRTPAYSARFRASIVACCASCSSAASLCLHSSCALTALTRSACCCFLERHVHKTALLSLNQACIVCTSVALLACCNIDACLLAIDSAVASSATLHCDSACSSSLHFALCSLAVAVTWHSHASSSCWALLFSACQGCSCVRNCSQHAHICCERLADGGIAILASTWHCSGCSCGATGWSARLACATGSGCCLHLALAALLLLLFFALKAMSASRVVRWFCPQSPSAAATIQRNEVQHNV